MAASIQETDFRVNDQVTVCDDKSSHYLRIGKIIAIHSIKGTIFYDVCLQWENGCGSSNWLLEANELYSETKFN